MKAELLTLDEGRYDPHNHKAVIMAGSPGSGKSTVRNLLFGGHGLKLVDQDEIRSAYQKLGKQGDYEKYGAMARKQRETYIEQGLGIIFDTTAWWKPGIQHLTKQLRALGYDVAMVHVYVPLHTAISRAEARAADTGRHVSEEDIVQRYKDLQQNSTDYAEMFGDHYWFVDNSHTRPNIDVVKRRILQWLHAPAPGAISRSWTAPTGMVAEASKKPLRVSAGVVITDGQEIILGHPTNGITWDIPKGGVDPGETHAQAAVREVQEETGLKIREKDLVHLGVYPYSSEKKVSMFVLRVPKLPDVSTLHCDSKFQDKDGVMKPELDDFRLATLDQAQTLLKPAMWRILNKNRNLISG